MKGKSITTGVYTLRGKFIRWSNLTLTWFNKAVLLPAWRFWQNTERSHLHTQLGVCVGDEERRAWAEIWPLIGSRKSHHHIWAPLSVWLTTRSHDECCFLSFALKKMASRENLTFEFYSGQRGEGRYSLLAFGLTEGTGVKQPSESSGGFSHSAVPPCFDCVHEAFSAKHSEVSNSFHTKRAPIQCYVVHLISEFFKPYYEMKCKNECIKLCC